MRSAYRSSWPMRSTAQSGPKFFKTRT
jgi:hypothetical protein